MLPVPGWRPPVERHVWLSSSRFSLSLRISSACTASRSSVRLSSLISVLVPNQRTTRPPESFKGMMRVRKARKRSVHTAQRKLHFKGFALGDGAFPSRQHFGQKVGMVDALPSPSQHLLGRRAREFIPALVIPIARAIGSRYPGKLGDAVGQGLESFLALAKCIEGLFAHLFRLLALRYVTQDYGEHLAARQVHSQIWMPQSEISPHWREPPIAHRGDPWPHLQRRFRRICPGVG